MRFPTSRAPAGRRSRSPMRCLTTPASPSSAGLISAFSPKATCGSATPTRPRIFSRRSTAWAISWRAARRPELLRPRLLSLCRICAVLAERARAWAHLGQEVHQRRRQRFLFEAVVHILPALLAPHDAGVLEHRKMLGNGRL